MLAETPDVTPAIDALRAYANDHASSLSPAHHNTLLEVVRRLQRLAVQATELIQINNKLWSKDGLKMSFDPASDTMIVVVGKVERRIKLNRADPNVPITMGNATSVAAYAPGKSKPTDDEQDASHIELEEKLESYYQSAHRVLKLLATIPPLGKVRCDPITRVRNNLVEHPQVGALYSFGYGSTGPRVKPMHQGPPAWNDDGLTPNTRAFVEAIVAACRSGAS